jgi:hypothetical protein
MKINRSLGLMLASTAFVSFASGAFALDGNDVLAKINALSSQNGIVIAAEGTSVDGENVTLSGVTATITTADNKKVPLGDVTLEGVTESDDSYDVKKASFADLNVMDKGSGVSATDIYVEGLSIPKTPEAGTLSSVMLADTIHVGATKIIADNKPVMSIDETTVNYTVADDESKIDFDADIAGLKIDMSSAPDPKAQETIQALGLQNLNGEITMKGGWTLADGRMDISEYAFDFENVGRLDIHMSLSGYTLAFMKSMQDAMKAAEANPDKAAGQQALGMSMMGLMQQLIYNSASIRFDDAGITAKALDYAGKQQGVDGKQFAQSLKGMLPMMLGQMNMPELQKQISDAANAYLDDPKSLEVTAVPGQPMPFPQIMGAAMGNPADLAKQLNVQVNANQ